jgi:hypothetical protein
MAIVNINQAWVTANGPAPITLAPNTTYVLTSDLNFTGETPDFGEPFLLPGPNTQLVLSNYYITLNSLDCPQVCDSAVYRRVSEYTIRPISTNQVHQYGTGIFFDGNNPHAIIPPNEFPPVVPYGQET